MVICTVIFIAVFGVMFYSILKHRKSVGHKAANFHESVGVEIAWTLVPFVIVIGMGALATRTVVAQKDTTNADLTIKATGYQWKWGYDYINGEGEGIAFLSYARPRTARGLEFGQARSRSITTCLKVDNPLVVPVDRKIRIVTTANDVIHSWMVPAFGVKQDAIPGFVRDTWFRADKTGDFYGQCVELCGKEHAYMPIHVKVVSHADYAGWVDGQKKAMAALADDPNKEWKLEELIARGEKVYAANCVACHRADGKGCGADQAAGWKRHRAERPRRADQDLAQRRGQWRDAVMEGLSDTEIAAVITYTQEQLVEPHGQAGSTRRNRRCAQVVERTNYLKIEESHERST